MPRRWEGDDHEHGVGDAMVLVPGASELVAAFTLPTWVAEQPDVHLRPHIEGWCAEDQRLALTAMAVDDRHAYVLDLAWRGPSGDVGQARAAVFALIGSFAEVATYVRQRRVSTSRADSATLQFEVGTGELAPDAQFEPHGHVVVINVAGVL